MQTCGHCKAEVEQVEVIDNQAVCEYCVDQLYARCAGCNDPLKLDDLYEMESGNYCTHCVTDSASKSDWDAFYGGQYDDEVV